MNTTLTTSALIFLSLTSGLVSAQLNREQLLEQLQVDEHTPIMELNVGQLITLVNNVPLAMPVCEDFSGFSSGQVFSPNTTATSGTVLYAFNYTGGARISDFPGYPGIRFLEMVEDGELIITLSADADDVTLELIQAATQANEIDYYNSQWHWLGGTFTAYHNQLDAISLSASGIRHVVIRHPELLVKSVCFQ